MRQVAEMRHHRRTFLDLADAFERLVPLKPAQLGKSVDLRRIVEHVVAERRNQKLPVHERSQRQEDEAALRTIAAPVCRAAFGQLTERCIAAAEHGKISRMAREATRDGNLGQRPQKGEVAHPFNDMPLDEPAERLFEFERLAVPGG